MKKVLVVAAAMIFLASLGMGIGADT